MAEACRITAWSLLGCVRTTAGQEAHSPGPGGGVLVTWGWDIHTDTGQGHRCGDKGAWQPDVGRNPGTILPPQVRQPRPGAMPARAHPMSARASGTSVTLDSNAPSFCALQRPGGSILCPFLTGTIVFRSTFHRMLPIRTPAQGMAVVPAFMSPVCGIFILYQFLSFPQTQAVGHTHPKTAHQVMKVPGLCPTAASKVLVLGTQATPVCG